MHTTADSGIRLLSIEFHQLRNKRNVLALAHLGDRDYVMRMLYKNCY